MRIRGNIKKDDDVRYTYIYIYIYIYIYTYIYIYIYAYRQSQLTNLSTARNTRDGYS